ncbi:hypothetical protein [Sorangium sp. So ce388]|uniref:hypothetical protein n=1 Tax=Sorangium sp. So ce388 TaxID=3133309 RepID=UPI003F5BAD2A
MAMEVSSPRDAAGVPAADPGSKPDGATASQAQKPAAETPSMTKEAEAAFTKMSRISVYLAIAIFLLNMACAWWVASASNRLISQPLVTGGTTAVARAIEAAPSANANTHVFLNRLLEAEIQLRVVQNRQTISIVAMGAGFALVAIGFALFVMGADGAFTMKGNVGDRGNLVIKATAPGLLCFVLAAIVVYASLGGVAQVASSPFTIYPDSAAAAVQALALPSPGDNTSSEPAPPASRPPASSASAERAPRPVPAPVTPPRGGVLGPEFTPSPEPLL